MRVFLLSLLPALAATGFSADPPSKRSGFFGFGSSSSEQISAGLFPETATSSPYERNATNDGGPTREGIFRSGQPQKIEATSYVIENGRKVEKPVTASFLKKTDAPTSYPGTTDTVPLAAPAAPAAPVAPALPPVVAAPAAEQEEKKRGGFFGFGKRGENEVPGNPVVDPVPVPAPLVASPKPIAATPIEVKPTTVPPAEIADTPSFAGVKEEKTSWIPFLNRKKNDAPAPVVASEIPSAIPVPGTTVAAAPVPASPAAAKPADKPASPEVATFEIRRDDTKPTESKKEEKPDREGGILTPITKMRPPKKEIDLTGAETIIQNGEIVGASEGSFAAPPESKPSGAPQAPQVVNGVKTYSSWGDVNAQSSSAADKIINRIR